MSGSILFFPVNREVIVTRRKDSEKDEANYPECSITWRDAVIVYHVSEHPNPK
jgi:hypothetical protein